MSIFILLRDIPSNHIFVTEDWRHLGTGCRNACLSCYGFLSDEAQTTAWYFRLGVIILAYSLEVGFVAVYDTIRYQYMFVNNSLNKNNLSVIWSVMYTRAPGYRVLKFRWLDKSCHPSVTDSFLQNRSCTISHALKIIVYLIGVPYINS